MKAMKNRDRYDLPVLLLEKWGKGRWVGNLLINTLMGTAVIEEFDALVDHPLTMALAEEQDTIQAFAPDAAEKALTQRIGTRSLAGCVEQVNVSTSNGPFKREAILVIIVTNQKAWTKPEGCRLAHLLSNPRHHLGNE